MQRNFLRQFPVVLSTPDIQLYAIDYSIPRRSLVLEFKLSDTSPITVSAAFEQRHNLVI